MEDVPLQSILVLCHFLISSDEVSSYTPSTITSLIFCSTTSQRNGPLNHKVEHLTSETQTFISFDSSASGILLWWQDDDMIPPASPNTLVSRNNHWQDEKSSEIVKAARDKGHFSKLQGGANH